MKAFKATIYTILILAAVGGFLYTGWFYPVLAAKFIAIGFLLIVVALLWENIYDRIN